MRVPKRVIVAVSVGIDIKAVTGVIDGVQCLLYLASNGRKAQRIGHFLIGQLPASVARLIEGSSQPRERIGTANPCRGRHGQQARHFDTRNEQIQIRRCLCQRICRHQIDSLVEAKRRFDRRLGISIVQAELLRELHHQGGQRGNHRRIFRCP